MMLAIFLSVLPLAAAASLLAWRGYAATLDLGAERDDMALRVVLARQLAAVQDAADTMVALAGLPGTGDPRHCPALAATTLRLSAGRLAALAVWNGAGALVCEAGTAAPLPSAPFRPANLATGVGGVLAGTAARRADGAVLPLAATERGLTGIVTVTGLFRLELIDRPVDGLDALWIVRAHGILERIDAAAPAGSSRGSIASPNASEMGALAAGRGPVFARGPGDGAAVYSAGFLPGDTMEIGLAHVGATGLPAADLLVRHISAIALLLLFGLLAVAVGAHVAVVAPVQALTRRVTRWRGGEPFVAGPLRFEPRELAELGATFELAVAALAERERALAEATAAQELLIKEIHHRVKNNLQIVASLLNLQSSRIRAPEAKAEFSAARDRVRALATLHRHLYTDGALNTVAMRPFLAELCGQLFQAMGTREDERVRLDLETPDFAMSGDQAVPFALIITEAVSNALKYAFPGDRRGRVTVRITRLDDRRVALVMEDDGVGAPSTASETETGIRDGLGRQLIRGFARQLGATLSVSEQDGTRYELLLALKPTDGDVERGASSSPMGEPVALGA